jgi:hypothetical protein
MPGLVGGDIWVDLHQLVALQTIEMSGVAAEVCCLLQNEFGL